MAEQKESCVKPAKGPVIAEMETEVVKGNGYPREDGGRMLARVGKPAPDFELSAFVDGGFKNIRLSDYKGKWIVLCFYPGDFTFV
jgi:peroxiredoxin (alkyl hydroperoxide reductase subunit C)